MPAKQGPKSGDFTGRERERLAKEHAAEQTEASKRMTLINQVEQAEADEGVYDPTSQELISASQKAEQTKTQYVAKQESTEPKDLTKDPVNVAAYNDPGPQLYDPDAGPNQYDKSSESPQVVMVEARAPRVVRAAEDIEQMTVGHGTIYSMEQGKQYRVPYEVAEHMERKGLVWH